MILGSHINHSLTNMVSSKILKQTKQETPTLFLYIFASSSFWLIFCSLVVFIYGLLSLYFDVSMYKNIVYIGFREDLCKHFNVSSRMFKIAPSIKRLGGHLHIGGRLISQNKFFEDCNLSQITIQIHACCNY